MKVNEEYDTIFEKRVVENLSNKTIIDIACGYCHVICLTEDSEVFAWGGNSRGQLGNGTTVDNSIPTIVNELKDKHIVSISCGEYHTLAMSSDGNVYAWGENRWAQLGTDLSADFSTTPTLVHTFAFINDRKITAISCGESHSLALTENGSVFGWGWNNEGQCGDGSDANRKGVTRVKLDNDIEIKKICCGRNHSLLLTSEGDVYSFGWNVYGELGIKSNNFMTSISAKIESSVKFVDIYSNHRQNISIALTESQKCFVWGKCGEENIRIPRETQFDSINETLLFYCNNKLTPKAFIL